MGWYAPSSARARRGPGGRGLRRVHRAVATSRGTATVKVPRGETVLAARTWQDRSQLWFQMFLVFAMPAAAPRKVAEEQRAGFGDAVVGLVETTVLASPGLMPLAAIDE